MLRASQQRRWSFHSPPSLSPHTEGLRSAATSKASFSARSAQDARQVNHNIISFSSAENSDFKKCFIDQYFETLQYETLSALSLDLCVGAFHKSKAVHPFIAKAPANSNLAVRLVKKLEDSQPHFIRCIRPSDKCVPNVGAAQRCDQGRNPRLLGINDSNCCVMPIRTFDQFGRHQ